MSRQPPTQELVAKDLHGNEWRFKHIFRGKFAINLSSWFDHFFMFSEIYIYNVRPLICLIETTGNGNECFYGYIKGLEILLCLSGCFLRLPFCNRFFGLVSELGNEK